MTTTHTPDLDALRAEFLDLQSRAAALIERCDQIRAEIRNSLPPGNYADGKVVVTAPRRFDRDKARKVLPPDLLPLVTVAVPASEEIDPKRAKNVLAPFLYDACRVEYGEHRVEIRA